ncbi:hypothetical protein [Rhizobium rhizogenes]|uniref:hypothetical protein n=1 Tax=Rhizobium rhizogenes TaxID=359 RepID=UPI0015716F2C|nr:hypothetical protein [Rhizobium rhizogenes]NTF82948.1 hypothetical protein [Rhizobium rhizogenes]NTI72472.1 hypothetical protein [Rhizobium rhizogenes]
MKDQTVILVRRFFPAAPQRGDWEFLSPVAGGTPQHWRALENLYRVLILAEPGAGKTFEARHQARKLDEKGKKERWCTDQISTVSAYAAAIENSLIDHRCHTNITGA